jgi:hypothetical protein
MIIQVEPGHDRVGSESFRDSGLAAMIIIMMMIIIHRPLACRPATR